jgi:transposase-like protein
MPRRKFTKKFKEAALRRLDQGMSMAEVARACDVSSNVLNRWRHELRNFGDKAFSGYGKSRDPIRPGSHNIVFRLTEDEFKQMKAASSAVGSRNLSDFVRSQVLRATSEPSLEQVDKKLNELSISVKQIRQMLAK